MATDLSPLTPAEQQGATTPAAAGGGGVDLSPLTPAERNTAPPPPSTWGVTNWLHGGDVTFPQSVQDFGDIAGERASAGLLNAGAAWQNNTDLATQKAKLDAAAQRLGPKLSTVADTVGYYASPTNLLNEFPGGGILSGALNEGLKSKLEGADWTTAGEHALQGALAGGAGSVLSRLAVMPKVLSNVTDYGLSALGAGASHLVFGDTVVPGSSALAGYLTHNAVQPAVKWVEKNSARLAPWRSYVEPLITGAGLSVPQTIQNMWSQPQR